jgi:hypothetical protein
MKRKKEGEPKIMKRKIVSILMSVVMIVTMAMATMPTALAAPITVSDEAEFLFAVRNATTGQTIQLVNNISISPLVATPIKIPAEIQIDLNGFTLVISIVGLEIENHNVEIKGPGTLNSNIRASGDAKFLPTDGAVVHGAIHVSGSAIVSVTNSRSISALNEGSVYVENNAVGNLNVSDNALIKVSGTHSNGTITVNGIIIAPHLGTQLDIDTGKWASYKNTGDAEIRIKGTVPSAPPSEPEPEPEQQWQSPLPNNPFIDVPNAPDWRNEAVSWAVRNNITTGSPAGSNTFNPNGNVTRAEFVTFLHRIYGKPIATSATFIDMPTNVDFRNAISWAFARGITTGSPAGSNTFMPNAPITREQIAAMLHRYIDGGVAAPNNVLGNYTDQNIISTWTGAREAVNWAAYYEIMGRNVTELNPRGNATRAEAATMLYRVVNIFGIPAP